MVTARRFRGLAVVLGALWGLGCGSETAAEDEPVVDAGATDSASAADQGSFYKLTVVLPSGLQQVFTRNLDETPTAFAFGSSHIAPAVSLAINDVLYDPFASIAFNFGFVVGSNQYPVTITEAGEWAFGAGNSNAPPGLKIEMKDQGIPRKFVSWLDGAKGQYLITHWGVQSGERVSGSLTGTLVNDGPEPVTAYVEGTFQFFLPEKGQGQ